MLELALNYRLFEISVEAEDLSVHFDKGGLEELISLLFQPSFVGALVCGLVHLMHRGFLAWSDLSLFTRKRIPDVLRYFLLNISLAFE